MKISFYQQSVPETELQQKEINRKTAPEQKNIYGQKAYFEKSARDWTSPGGARTEKGKSLIELQQEAANTDVAVQQDYMTLMSNTMSEEDYAKLQEEGFDFGSMDPEEAVTIVDKIKAELARSGKHIAGYTDDIDMETLTAALGSQTLAQAVSESFQAADLPLTEENLEAVSGAWEMASQLKAPEEGSLSYLIDNGMDGEIWNLYLAQNSGAGNSTGKLPRFYAENVQGYYSKTADTVGGEELQEQIDKVLVNADREVSGENRRRALWLLDKGLPLTEDNLNRLEELEQLRLPVDEKQFADSAAAAVSSGKAPMHGKLTGRSETVYEKAARVMDFYCNGEAAGVSRGVSTDLFSGDITARRQLEEIRLRMTAEVNVKLIKSGFSIDTAPMEQLVEALREAERQVAEQYFPSDTDAVAKYQLYSKTNAAVTELPALPAQALGTFARGQAAATLEEFHQTGRVLRDAYVKAGETYEALMTAPRQDMGDSIRKAFANVDDILADLGMELTDENRRAARILGYNRMELTMDSLEQIKAADRQVQTVVEKLTPAATLKMIRDGVNPLEQSFAELETYFDSLPEEYAEEAESYSKFLYGLERNKEITPEERESYIGIYRLLRQIEKSDGAAVGALVNTQAELHFSNLLSAVRSSRFKPMDVKAGDELGVLEELVRKGESIPSQIAKAFVGKTREVLTEVSYSDEAVKEYRSEQLEEYRSAVVNADEDAVAMLGRGQLTQSAENLLAAQKLLQSADDIFAAAGRRRRAVHGQMQAETTGENRGEGAEASVQSRSNTEEQMALRSGALWEKLESKATFTEEYAMLAEEALALAEEATLADADTSLDVRGMQLIHKQLTVVSSLAKAEEFFVPMYVGDTPTTVHLVFDRSGAEKGSVRINVRFSEDRFEAKLSVENGRVNGIFSAGSREEVMKLEKIADIFKEEASESWEVGDISIVNGTMQEVKTDAEDREAENTELYRAAKVFLHAVMQGVKTNEN